MESVVLTSDTPQATQDFYAQKLNLAPPEPAPAPEGEQKAVESVPEKDAPAPATEGDGEDVEQHIPNPEARQKVHYKFSVLTEKAKAAEAKAAEATAKAEAEARSRALAEQEAATLRAKYEPPKTEPVGPKPQRAQFVNDEEYEKAIEDHVTEKVTWEKDQRDRTAKIAKAWTDRQAAARAAIPDYDEAISASGNLEVHKDVENAIYESEQGPQILVHLAKNPEIVAKLATLDEKGRQRLFGKLEGKFETAPSAVVSTPAPAKEEVKPAVVAAEISRAPAPIVPLKSSKATPDTLVDSSGVFHGTYEQYKAGRKAGTIT